MEDIIRSIVEAYSNIGLSGIIALATIALAVLLLYDAGKLLNRRWLCSRWSSGKVSPSSSMAFVKMESMIDNRIPRLKIDCPLRKHLFVRMLTIETRTTLDVLKKVASTDVAKMSREQFKTMWIGALDGCFAMCEARFREIGIPQTACDRFRRFNRVNEEMIKNVVYQICDSDAVFDSQAHKSLAIIDFIGAIKDTFLIAAENTIDSLNGELSSVVFEGVRCRACRPDCPLRAYASPEGTEET